MSSRTIEQPRQIKGAPKSVGGQYMGNLRPEAGHVAGVGPATKGLNAEERAALRAQRAAERAARAEVRDNEAALFNMVERKARIATIKSGLSQMESDDVVGETFVSVLTTAKNNPGTSIKPGLVVTASFALASRRMDSHTSSANSTAFKRWKDAVAKAEAERGTSLSKGESDAIADHIRSTWHNPDKKPAKGFQNPVQVHSYEAYSADNSDIFAAEDEIHSDGSKYAHELADQVEDGDIQKLEARKQFWNIIADDTNAPLAVAGSVATTAAARHRREVRGNVVAVAEKFLTGAATGKESMALFAPFGHLDQTGKEAVAETLVRRGNYGHRMWLGALEYATGDGAAVS